MNDAEKREKIFRVILHMYIMYVPVCIYMYVFVFQIPGVVQ